MISFALQHTQATVCFFFPQKLSYSIDFIRMPDSYLQKAPNKGGSYHSLLSVPTLLQFFNNERYLISSLNLPLVQLSAIGFCHAYSTRLNILSLAGIFPLGKLMLKSTRTFLIAE